MMYLRNLMSLCWKLLVHGMHTKLGTALLNSWLVFAVVNLGFMAGMYHLFRFFGWDVLAIAMLCWIVFATICILCRLAIPYLPAMWLKHYTTTERAEAILVNGFHAPTQEIALMPASLGGQRNLDRVSFSLYRPEAYRKMVERQYPADTEFTYVWVKTKISDAEITSAIYMNVIATNYGWGFEVTANRHLANQAVERGRVRISKDHRHSFCWQYIVILLATSVCGRGLRAYADAANYKKTVIMI